MNGATDLTLIGFSDSTYSWSARLGLAECGLVHGWEEVNPFEDPGVLAGQQPFGRVPVLRHGDFMLYETSAILIYADALSGAGLVPDEAQAEARVHQVMSITNAHVYGPLVRQVYAHGVYRPRHGAPSDAVQIAEGLAAAETVLDALEAIAAEGLVLRADRVDAGAVLLAPMLVMFGALPEARQMLIARPALWAWFGAICARPALRATCPDSLMGELPE